jgi:hypothetical protein
MGAEHCLEARGWIAAQADVWAASARRLLPAERSHQLRAHRVTALATPTLSLLSSVDRLAHLRKRVREAGAERVVLA